MTTVLKTIDVGTADTVLSHLEARELFARSLAEATTASSILAAIVQSCPPPIDDDPRSLDRWESQVRSAIEALPDDQRSTVELALSDSHVVVDFNEPGFTRADLPTRIEGVIVDESIIHPLHEPSPGARNSQYDDRAHWAMDQLTSILTGIHPDAGDVAVTTRDVDRLLLKPAFVRLLSTIRNQDGTPKYTRTILHQIVLARPEAPVKDSLDEGLSHPNTRSRPSPRWLPPPDPSDELPPDAVRPRTTGRSLQRGSIMFDSETTPVQDMEHESARLKRILAGEAPVDWPSYADGNDVRRRPSDAPPPPAVRDAVSKVIRSLDEQVSRYMRDMGAVTNVLARLSTSTWSPRHAQ